MSEPTDPAQQSKYGKIMLATIQLETPITTASGEKTELRFRRPLSGDLRGLAIGKLGQFEYDEIRRLLPRISLDGLTVEVVDQIDVADQLEIAGAISDFLVPMRRKAEFQAT